MIKLTAVVLVVFSFGLFNLSCGSGGGSGAKLANGRYRALWTWPNGSTGRAETSLRSRETYYNKPSTLLLVGPTCRLNKSQDPQSSIYFSEEKEGLAFNSSWVWDDLVTCPPCDETFFPCGFFQVEIKAASNFRSGFHGNYDESVDPSNTALRSLGAGVWEAKMTIVLGGYDAQNQLVKKERVTGITVRLESIPEVPDYRSRADSSSFGAGRLSVGRAE